MAGETENKFYASINEDYLFGASELLILSSLSMIPNLYFLIRAFTYKDLYNSKLHRNIILGMTLSYIFASLTSLIVMILYFYHYIMERKIHIYSCNVLRRIATICTNFVYVMPLFISIVRFFNLVLQKSINALLFTTIVILIEIPNFSKQLSPIISSDVVRSSDTICGVSLVMVNPIINVMSNIDFSITIAAPIVGCFLNFVIYKMSVRKKNSQNESYIKQERSLFISVLIQSLFPLVFHGTSSAVPFIMNKFKVYKDIGWRIVDFIIYFGYATCILVSSFFVKTLKYMILKDIGFKIKKISRNVTIKRTNNYTGPLKIKS